MGGIEGVGEASEHATAVQASPNLFSHTHGGRSQGGHPKSESAFLFLPADALQPTRSFPSPALRKAPTRHPRALGASVGIGVGIGVGANVSPEELRGVMTVSAANTYASDTS
jgi:hypothetical protein